MDTTMTVRLSQADKEIIAHYAKSKGRSTSDIVREAILERIEDDLDLALYRQAMAEHQENPVSFSLDEVAKLLEIEL